MHLQKELTQLEAMNEDKRYRIIDGLVTATIVSIVMVVIYYVLTGLNN